MLSPRFWSLLLDLTSSIPPQVCSEILLERHFYQALVGFIQAVLHDQGDNRTAVQDPSVSLEDDAPPTKKRRLSPPASPPADIEGSRATLLWTALQATSRCVNLISSPSSFAARKFQGHASSRALPTPLQAALFGTSLDLVASNLNQSANVVNAELIAETLNVVVAFWTGDASAGALKYADRHQAFASYSLQPSLALLELLLDSNSDYKLFVRTKDAIERLIALHVVFPLRTLFNDQFSKKWKGTAHVLLYEQMETLLNAYSAYILPSKESDSSEVVGQPVVQRLSWIILQVAACSIPISDLRRRQSEQQYFDSLFIWLVHIAWPHIPRVASTGALRQQFAGSRKDWASSLESLLEVANSKKLHISQPTISYIMQATLATDSPLAPWTLLTKVAQLNINILMPSSTRATSDFLPQIIARIESTTVSRVEYNVVRDRLILPLLRCYAGSRALEDFVSAWQHCLAEAIRARYILKHDHEDIPTVLVWDDDDLFAEFKTLSVRHGPPKMAERMLKDLIAPVRDLAGKVGSTADVFARLTIFCTMLETASAEDDKFTSGDARLTELFRGAMDALARKSDYQAQRWKLRKLIRTLAGLMEYQALPAKADHLLEPEYQYSSIKDVYESDNDHNSSKSPQFLDSLECFSLLLELATKSDRYQVKLTAEIRQLASAVAARGIYDYPLWDGRSSNCDKVYKLVAACVGRLSQKPKLFWQYPAVFRTLVEVCMAELTQESTALRVGASPNVVDLWGAFLQLENIAMSQDLRQVILDAIAKYRCTTAKLRKSSQELLHGFSPKTVGKSNVKWFADPILQRLLEDYRYTNIKTVADDLNYLLYLESILPGAFIRADQVDNWIHFSQAYLERKSDSRLASETLDNADFMISYLNAVHAMDKIFEAICKLLLTAAEPKSTLIHIIGNASHRVVSNVAADGEEDLPFSCVQTMLRCAYQRGYQDDHFEDGHALRKVYDLFFQRLQWHFEQIVRHEWNSSSLLKLKLIAVAADFLGTFGNNDKMRQITRAVQRKLKEGEVVMQQSMPIGEAHRTEASLQYWLSLSASGSIDIEKEPDSAVLELASSMTLGSELTNEAINLLAMKAGAITRRIGPSGWSHALRSLNRESSKLESGLGRDIIVASILTNIREPYLAQYPQLSQDLIMIARLDLRCHHQTLASLFFALENCRTVLELSSQFMNQSTLDHLLASMQVMTAAANESIQSSTVVGNAGPRSEDIYNRLCAVLGAILARHRRRLSDRYHLLLPLLQNLLRCLFWPGQTVIASQRATATNAIATFGKTLPGWMRDSTQPLPFTSAEQLSRLLSAICNPTVSSARSTKKRYNELNDDVKKVRKSAAQHLQYLVMEYCRCVLEGQISPAMKDHIMPGMYRVLDAIDRDLMRAMNAGMDPSTGAIFKNLYDDWTRYGRWDKN